MTKCTGCSYRFAVVESVSAPEERESGEGVVVSYKATMSMPRYCPKCGRNLEADVRAAMMERVKWFNA